MEHSWPGNVRELKNVLERALIFYEPELLQPQHLRIDHVPESWQAAMSPISDFVPHTFAASSQPPTTTSPTLTPANVMTTGSATSSDVAPLTTLTPDFATTHTATPEPSSKPLEENKSTSILNHGAQSTAESAPAHCASQPAAVEVIHTLTNDFRLPNTGIKLEDLEKSLLNQALDQARHNQTRAAQLLGITRHTLRYRMEKHGLLVSNSALS
jgi:DNA-binding NtrC family response regulator